MHAELCNVPFSQIVMLQTKVPRACNNPLKVMLAFDCCVGRTCGVTMHLLLKLG